MKIRIKKLGPLLDRFMCRLLDHELRLTALPTKFNNGRCGLICIRCGKKSVAKWPGRP